VNACLFPLAGLWRKQEIRKCLHQLMRLSANSPEAIGFGWFSGNQPKKVNFHPVKPSQ
jgi:hypothetical protein